VTGSVIAATSGGSNNESGGLFSSGSGTVLVPGTPSLGAPR
jgi:hypothetical protein